MGHKRRPASRQSLADMSSPDILHYVAFCAAKCALRWRLTHDQDGLMRFASECSSRAYRLEQGSAENG